MLGGHYALVYPLVDVSRVQRESSVADECLDAWKTCLFSNSCVSHKVRPSDTKNAALTLHVKSLQSFAICLENGPCQLHEEESTEHRMCISSALFADLDGVVFRRCRAFQLY